ncbi:MAG: hypothetical protein JWP12_432 [Bacteroidetes bacterium]|nr:hypothetical protein [Bacteroidota bacterium]
MFLCLILNLILFQTVIPDLIRDLLLQDNKLLTPAHLVVREFLFFAVQITPA